MKKMIIINGTMGVGKSTVCKELYKRLDNSVWLDGDWCWMMNPWVVNDENRKMVEQNIHFLLKSFLRNTGFSHVLFNWVIHTEDIMDSILAGLEEFEFRLYKISLLCQAEQLAKRMAAAGRINIQASIDRLDLYRGMDTIKVDTTDKNVLEIVNEIIRIIR